MSNKPPPGLREEYHKQYLHLLNNLLRWKRKLNRRIPGGNGPQEATARVEQWQQRLNDCLARTRPQSPSERSRQQ